MSRRLPAFVALVALAVTSTVGCGSIADHSSPLEPTASDTATIAAPFSGIAAIEAIEREHDVTVGFAALGDGGRTLEYAGDDRFAYASTLKVFVAAALPDAVPADDRAADVRWTQAQVDASGYSPVTSQHIDAGSTLEALAEAAVRTSDNTAANLVMDAVGGPAGVEAYLRELGDAASVVTDHEPELNTVTAGSERNTTKPMAFATALQQVFESDSLPEAERRMLLEWMSDNATGDALIRAGAPSGWTVADKSGGAGGVRNDIAVVTTPKGERLYVAIFTAENDPTATYSDAVVEEVARVVLAEFAPPSG
ncbi:class A beta-lactamase [uncultured Microbacterium sp.]|uniref:class A beta-lactamase n=1 Tax=uncultured Microbacterium sp. TaxID=191216 RepID=UPI0028DB66F1|nr:class A beta-lactamase [uncultured Microbacterium sp.]